MLSRAIAIVSLSAAIVACGAATGDPPLEASDQAPGMTPAPLRVASASGHELGFIPAVRSSLDRVEWDVDARHGRAVASVRDGWDGTSRLVVLEGDGAARELLRFPHDRVATRPIWSPSGHAFAWVVQRPPERLGIGRDAVLRHHGELWVGATDGTFRRLSVAGSGRVLGWLDAERLIVTRLLDGDLPEERPLAVRVRDGYSTELLGSSPQDHHYYGFTWQGGRLFAARAKEPVVTAAAPWQSTQLVEIVPGEAEPIVLAKDRGALPSAIELRGNAIRYRREGVGAVREVNLLTGESRSLDAASPPPPPPGPWQIRALLKMPYVHQVYDTADEFNGNWACGPTSTLMAICHFGRLEPWTMTASTPSPHDSPFGAYVSRVYTAHGATFDRMQTDASGHASYGAYGWCTEDGAAWAWRMQDYAELHGLATEFDDGATFQELQSALAAGKVVALSTQLTSAGHIITVKGTTANGELVVNDPYGDWNAGYMNYDGEGAVYAFGDVAAKWFITVYATGPQYKAALVEALAPATMVGGTTATATLTLRNEGTQQWDDQTLLGTVEPRDRASSFHTPGEWMSDHRVAAAPEVTSPGAVASWSFTLTAPAVCEPTTYTESFNLVQEGVVWFSDDGGPTDGEIVLTIQVEPEPGACAEAGAADAGLNDAVASEDVVESDAAAQPDTLEGGDSAFAEAGKATAQQPQLDGCACGLPMRRGESGGRWGWAWVAVVLWRARRLVRESRLSCSERS